MKHTPILRNGKEKEIIRGICIFSHTVYLTTSSIDRSIGILKFDKNYGNENRISEDIDGPKNNRLPSMCCYAGFDKKICLITWVVPFNFQSFHNQDGVT